jgi:predicted AlkP superfamily phosphohydrolase/phosphomutase
MLARNDLPNLARIRQKGGYTRLATTYPAQTPVAWSSFATGVNPGGHGIFDFISRDPQTYLADFALTRFEPPKNAFSLPRVVNRRQGRPVWQYLSEAGVPSTILRCPCTFPPDAPAGRIIAGVGVPDVRGSQGRGTFYTQEPNVAAHENEQVVLLESGSDLSTYVIGPRNPKTNPPSDLRCPVRVRINRATGKLVFEFGGTPSQLEIGQGCWSDWVRFKFKISMLQSVTGIARIYVRETHPNVQFYISAVSFDPAAPMFPISSPAQYAKDIADAIGLFSTVGMAEEHNGLENGRIDERAFLAQCELVMKEREALMRHELARFREGLFFILYDTPDRLQHMLWRFRDPEHPGFNSDLAPEFKTSIEDHYHRCDRLLGGVVDGCDEDTLLIVLSDHGFNTFRRAFDTNTWLHQNGLLALKNGVMPGQDLGEGFASVDWSRTYAYALGLGGIYLNVKGREREGILELDSAEAERVKSAIETGMAALPDAQTQRPAIRDVSRKELLYSGPYTGNSPDLLVNFHPGFRVSWQSAVGGFANTLFEDNLRRWSGDHIVAPESVPGVLFMNRPIARARASMVDLAPTILQHLGVTVPKEMEGSAV